MERVGREGAGAVNPDGQWWPTAPGAEGAGGGLWVVFLYTILSLPTLKLFRFSPPAAPGISYRAHPYGSCQPLHIPQSHRAPCRVFSPTGLFSIWHYVMM